MVECRPRMRPHATKGVELVVTKDCEATIKEVMKELGPYGQQYWKRRLVYEEKGADIDTPSK